MDPVGAASSQLDSGQQRPFPVVKRSLQQLDGPTAVTNRRQREGSGSALVGFGQQLRQLDSRRRQAAC